VIRFAVVLCACLIFASAGCNSGGSSVAPPSASPLPFTSSAAIWFHPMPQGNAWPNDPNPDRGSSDFLALFQANAPWPRTMARTKVIGLYAGWVLFATDQELQLIVGFLNAHGMGIELESPALQALPTCGTGVEGYVPWKLSIHDLTIGSLQRLKALGAQVQFVKVDEPFYFGNVVPDPRSCHFSVPQIAAEVGQFSDLVKTVYPNAVVGDVEPIVQGYAPDVVTALGQWHDTYKVVTGAPLAFFFADIDYTNAAWPTTVKALEDGSRLRGMRFGIIYTGDDPDTSDQQWTTKSVNRFETYQGAYGGRPDYVLFQSWQRHPTLCLPETDSITFTGVIDAYIAATTASSTR
jgi:hypothetical protein